MYKWMRNVIRDGNPKKEARNARDKHCKRSGEFDGLIFVLNPPEERISGDTSIKISKTGKRKYTK